MISDFHAPRQHERGIFIPILHTSLKESIMEPIQVQAIRKILEDELRPAMASTAPKPHATPPPRAPEHQPDKPQKM